MSQPPITPFSVHPGGGAGGILGRVAALAAPLVDPLLGLTALDRLYAGLAEGNFIDRALERLGVAVSMPDDHLRHVPATGPTIVTANHPTGALDGLALAHALLRRRSDVRLLGNHVLSRVPEMRDWTIAVNPFDPRSIENQRGVRAARQWLARGGLLIVFPAGAVSNVARHDGGLEDGAWQQGAVSLARWSSATVVPAFIDAQPSRWFRIAALIHPRLRTALLPRELLRLRNRVVTVRLGKAVAAERLAGFGSRPAQMAYLRAHSYALEPAGRSSTGNDRAPLVDAVDPAALQRDIEALPRSREVCRQGDCSVYCAAAFELPHVLREIGRLRELTFRAAGEGTGRSIDLDQFDHTYQHLFVWNHARQEVAGAYRIGATDRVCRNAGRRALYTHTLFRLSPGFVKELGPALELGRSFVRAEYQRESNALLLLWKGIGSLVAQEPRYRHLFGPVSISSEYSRPSRALLSHYLSTAGADPAWSRHVRARCAPADDPFVRRLADGSSRTLTQLDSLVRDLNVDRGVPVLVRQYWKLGAKVLGCSVDHAFGGSLDALMLVDLTQVALPVLQRYLGRDGAAVFRRHHGLA
jgi:putative hemolysin